MGGFPTVRRPSSVAEAAQLARRDPVIVVAVGLAILLVALAYVLWRRRYRTPGKRFRKVLAARDAVAVLLHPNPDPDALATGLGVSFLADRVGTTAIMQYPGEIRRPENRAFVTVLDVTCESIDTVADLADDSVVLVDHNEARGLEGAGGLTPDAVIDHHPGEGRGRSFSDVRPDYGACATIIAEYLNELGYVPGAENDDDAEGPPLPEPVATGLLYGILADTNRLTRGCTAAEFNAAEYLYPGTDSDSLDRIAHPAVDSGVLEVKARAISNRQVDAPFAVADVGTVPTADAIPVAAEELLSLEGVSAVVVYGDLDETIHLSGRSRDDRLHMGEALATVVQDIGMSDAGGHARMGGGQISIAHMEGLRPESGMSREDLTERLFEAMAGER